MQFESISLDFQFQRTLVISRRKYSKSYMQWLTPRKIFQVLYVVDHTSENNPSLVCSGSHLEKYSKSYM